MFKITIEAMDKICISKIVPIVKATFYTKPSDEIINQLVDHIKLNRARAVMDAFFKKESESLDAFIYECCKKIADQYSINVRTFDEACKIVEKKTVNIDIGKYIPIFGEKSFIVIETYEFIINKYFDFIAYETENVNNTNWFSDLLDFTIVMLISNAGEIGNYENKKITEPYGSWFEFQVLVAFVQAAEKNNVSKYLKPELNVADLKAAFNMFLMEAKNNVS